MQPWVLMVPSSSFPANTVFLSLPSPSRRLNRAFLPPPPPTNEGSVAAHREREKFGGLSLAGQTFSPHPVFVLALLKHLRGVEGREGEGEGRGPWEDHGHGELVITGGDYSS